MINLEDYELKKIYRADELPITDRGEYDPLYGKIDELKERYKL